MTEGTVASTVGTLLTDATRALSQAGCDTPRLDAELLLASVLGVQRARLVVERGAAVPAGAPARFEELLMRRAAREPVAYILGKRKFRRVSLMVDPRVLIPRPETELLVEVGLTVSPGGRVVDVGTGSGAVALALKDERPDLSVLGSDVDRDALALARANGAALGLDVRFVEGDLMAGLRPAGEQFDVVLANLPYVAEHTELQPEIAAYEPRRALFAGPDGLAVVRRLIAMLDGVELVALEVGHDQAAAVSAMLAQGGYRSVQRIRDLAGHERVLVGRR